jgi:glycosyltransferase involved in cell wall biosynthesis
VDVHFLAGRNGHSLLSNARAFLRTQKLAKELSGYDVLLLVGPDAGALPATHRAKRYNPGLKLLWVYHGLTPPEFLPGLKDKLLTRIRRASYLSSMRRSDLVQADSVYVTGELKAAGVDASKLVAMPVGVDLRRFASGDRDGVRARYGIGDSFLLMYVGRLASLKRVDDLVRAVADVKKGDFKLMVVGGGPERDRLGKLAAELGVGDAVTFTGRIGDEELPDYYAACDAWVTASRHEGFCVPIVEAMAAGKPVVVPDTAAMPETAGSAGLTYRAGDLDALERKVKMLKGDGRLYASLCSAARERAGAFDISRVMERYVEMVLRACK